MFGPAHTQARAQGSLTYIFTLTPLTVVGGNSVTATLSIQGGNGAGTANVTSSNTGVIPNLGVVQIQGPLVFPLGTATVTVVTSVTITADFGGGNKRVVTLTVLPLTLNSITVSPTSAAGPSVGTVTLNGPSPAAGTVVTLTNPNPTLITAPATVTVPGGFASVTFPVTGAAVPANTTGQLQATAFMVTRTATFAVLHTPAFNLAGDGNNDLLVQNLDSRQVSLWSLNSQNVVTSAAIDLVPLVGWNVVAAADFDNDGQADLLFQNTTTGQLVIWTLTGTHVASGHFTSLTPDPDYVVVATGDFNNDGNIDLMFQSQSTGTLVVWFMRGARVLGGVALPALPDAGWNVVGAGDFNGDGWSDVLLQNAATGQLVVWYLQGTDYLDGAAFPGHPDAGWKAKGVADYNNDGHPDIVFQNTTTGQTVIWLMNNTTFVDGDFTSVQPGFLDQVVGPH